MSESDSVVSSCPEVLPYYNSTQQHVIMLLHVLVSLFGIIFTAVLVVYGKAELYFHKNCTLLVYLICLCHVFECLSIGGSQAFHLVLLQIKSSPCDLMVSNWLCLFLRSPSVFFNAYMAFLYCATILERFLAIRLCDQYEEKFHNIGRNLAFVMLLPACFIWAYSFQNYPFDKNSWYCATAISETMKDLAATSNVLAVVTVMPVVALAALWVYNQKIGSRHMYNMAIRYQISENQTVLRLLAPQVILFSTFQCGFSIINSVSYLFRKYFPDNQDWIVFLAAINISVYHSLFSTILFLSILLRNKGRRRRSISRMQTSTEQQRDAYFNAYQQQWNSK